MSADHFDLDVISSAPVGISASCLTISEGFELAAQAFDQEVAHLDCGA